MTNRMIFKRYPDAAYIAYEGDTFGVSVGGADLAHLELILRRHRMTDHDAILRDFYQHVALRMNGEFDTLMAEASTRH